ncbi:MAG: ABC transporter ATP-binding protein [Armatimonadota bacterium]|nr:ABC transporter ATP-binding protein [Armatimonadota bacterium]MDR7548878.1 ABC transporter ATP-binding protein [Armatimonadota bacterium]
MLDVQGLWAGYDDVPLVRDVHLEVPATGATAVLGSNGAGKTTLFRAIVGLLRPWRGTVRFDGELLSGQPPHEMVRRGVVYVPAERELFPQLTVAQHLELGAYCAPGLLRSGLQRVYTLFPRLAERKEQRASTLSGGEQQMLAIARALMAAPRLLLLDEPSTGLAPRLVADLYRQLGTLLREGVTILLAEQHVQAALNFCQRVYVLKDGRIAYGGPAGALRGNPELYRTYLGETLGPPAPGGPGHP